MSEYQNEPSGDTEQFRAFARGGGEPESTSGGPNIALILGGVVAVVIVIAVVAYLAI